MSTRVEDKTSQNGINEQQKNFLEAVRRGQEPLWEDPGKGLVTLWTRVMLKNLQKKSLEHNSPLSNFLDDSFFKLEIIKKALISIIFELQRLDFDKNIDPANLVNQVGENLSEIINNVLKNTPGFFRVLSESIDISPILLSMVGGALVQPSMIYTADQCKQEYLDAWERTNCPVCGRLPSIVIKSDKGPWRFKCTYCWSEYKMDIFICSHCGAQGFENIEFVLVGENKEYEIAACKECKRYYKIINKVKLKKSLPDGLEDLYTAFLDDIALEKDLIRLDT